MAESRPARTRSRALSAGRRRSDQIKGGRHGLTPDQVADSQQERIVAAMLELSCERGYASVRVGELIERAGVSRKTLYEHYRGKEEAFVAAYDEALAGILAQTLASFEGDGPWVDRLRAALDALLAALAAEPRAARICFVESLAAGPQALARRNEAIAGFEALFDGPGGDDGPRLERPRAVAAGRVADLAEILNREIAAGRIEALPQLRGELMYALVLPFLGPEAAAAELERPMRAVEARRPPRKVPPSPTGNGRSGGDHSNGGPAPVAGAAPKTSGPQPLWPRGSTKLTRGYHDLPADQVLAVQRDRLLRGMVRSVAQRGYHDTTVRRLAATAGVSVRSFYELFRDREECFLAAYDDVAAHLLARVAAATRDRPAPEARLRAGVAALLDFCADEPDLARLAIVEVLAAGPAARARRERTMRRLAELFEAPLRDLRPDPRVAQVSARVLVGGVHELIYDPVDRRDPSALPALDVALAAASLATRETTSA